MPTLMVHEKGPKERLTRKKMYYNSVRNRLLTQKHTHAREESGFLRNLSESGICISTANPLKPEDVISLYFRLPAVAYNFYVKAKVVWVGGEKAGCEFLHLNEEEKILIRKRIEDSDPAGLYNYYQKVYDYFTYKVAYGRDKYETFKLRYLIYVKENGWEPENAEGMETDDFDTHSEHFIVKDKNEVAIASTRLIFSEKTLTPIEKFFGIDITSGKKFKREEIAEVSRLCIAREYRRRIEDLKYNEGQNAGEKEAPSLCPDKEKQRTPTLLFALWKMMYQYSLKKGIKYWYMETEPRLANSLINAGIKLEKAGEAKEYHGRRTPYFVNLMPAAEEMKRQNPALLQWFETEFGEC